MVSSFYPRPQSINVLARRAGRGEWSTVQTPADPLKSCWDELDIGLARGDISCGNMPPPFRSYSSEPGWDYHRTIAFQRAYWARRPFSICPNNLVRNPSNHGRYISETAIEELTVIIGQTLLAGPRSSNHLKSCWASESAISDSRWSINNK